MRARVTLAGWLAAGMIWACGSTIAQAADLGAAPLPAPAPAPVATDWAFSMNLYGWASGIDGKMRTLPPLPAVNVNIGFDQIIKNLDGALMGTAELDFGRAFLFGDLVAAKISPGKTFTRPNVAGDITLDSTTVIGTATAGFRFYDDGRISVDGLAGVRIFSADNSLDVTFNRFTTDYGKSASWVDGVAGLRLKYALAQDWTATFIALAGGISSNYEWDLFAGVGYRINERWGAFVGYRALKVDYEAGNFIYDVLQHGPVLGVNIRF
jgi:hypothetical protein